MFKRCCFRHLGLVKKSFLGTFVTLAKTSSENCLPFYGYEIFHWGAKYLNHYPLYKPLSPIQAQHRKGLKTRQTQSPEPGTILMTPFGNPAFTVNSANFKAAIDVTWKYISHLRASYHHLEIHKEFKCSKWQPVLFISYIFYPSPTVIYLFKVNNENKRTMCEICSKLAIKTRDELISHFVQVFPLLTMNKSM